MTFLDADELAQRLGVTPARARRLMAADEVPTFRLGRKAWVPEAAFERWILERTRYPEAQTKPEAAERMDRVLG